jgi:hypothetical protein
MKRAAHYRHHSVDLISAEATAERAQCLDA